MVLRAQSVAGLTTPLPGVGISTMFGVEGAVHTSIVLVLGVRPTHTQSLWRYVSGEGGRTERSHLGSTSIATLKSAMAPEDDPRESCMDLDLDLDPVEERTVHQPFSPLPTLMRNIQSTAFPPIPCPTRELAIESSGCPPSDECPQLPGAAGNDGVQKGLRLGHLAAVDLGGGEGRGVASDTVPLLTWMRTL